MAIITNVIKKMKDEKFTQFIDGQLVVGSTVIDVISDPGVGGPSMIPVTAYASAINGTGFTLTNSETLDYQAWVVLDATVTPVAGDFAGKWFRRKGLPGVNGTGTPGTDGQQSGFAINFSTLITATKPGTGKIQFNNANPALATEMYIDEESPSAVDMSGLINTFIDGMQFMLRLNSASGATLGVFELTAAPTDNGDWFTIPITNRLMSSTTFADGDQCTFQFFGGGGSGGSVTEAAIIAASAVVRIADAGGGTSKLIDTTNSTISSVSPVYKLPAFTITGVSNLPAANTFPHGAVVRLHQDCLVGAGSNPMGIMLQADNVNNIWKPFGPQILFIKPFGNIAAPTCSLTAAGKFDLGAGGDPVIPANLFNVNSRLAINAKYRKLGTTLPVIKMHLGTDLSVRTNNSAIYQQTFTASANMDVTAAPRVGLISGTAGLSSRVGALGGGGASGSFSDADTLISIAAAMKLTFEASTLASDTIYMYDMMVVWEY